MRRILVIFCLLLSWSVQAQIPRFVNYSAADGLPSNTVYAVTQDLDGILWVGTRGGLCRFDGVQFRTVMADKRITSLAVDRENRLWVGTTEGILLDGKMGPQGNVRALLADSEGAVWATVGDSLLLKMSASPEGAIKEEVRTFYNKRYHEGDYPYFQIFEDGDGVLWLGGRLVRAQFVNDRLQPRTQIRFSDTYCTGSYAEVNGVLYAIDDHFNTLNTFDGTEVICHGRLPVAHARLLTDSKGRLWAAGSYGLGLVDIDKPEATVVYRHSADNPHSVASQELYCIFEDRQGNIWVGGDNGLSVLSPVFQVVKTLDLPTARVSALMEASDGRLWVGTSDAGTFILPGPVQVSPDSPVSALYEDRGGSVYMGLYSGKGFDVWTNGRLRRGAVRGPIPRQQEVVASGDRITSNWIMDFLEGRDGRFYVVTWEGVGINEWDRKTGQTLPPEWLSPFYYPTPQVDSNIFLSSRLGSRLVEDAAGNLIYGTTEAGLNIIDKKTRLVSKYLPDPADSLSIPDNYVTDLCLSPDGTLWVATHSGLWSPSGKCYLRGKLVQSVKTDDKGRLWAGTEEGLYFVDTDGSIGVARKALGFPSDIYGEKTACRLSDGRLAFGGPEGAAVFHPDSLLALKASGNLLLTSLIRQRYRLDKGAWQDGPFIGLPDKILPGRYTLEEQRSDIFGRWEKGESSVRTLSVPLPLWLRWPFLLLYVAILGAFVWTVIRLRERRLLVKELDMRNQFFSIISHDLRNPVSGNRLLSHQLLQQLDSLSHEQLKEALGALARSTDNTASLLENLLLWSLNQKGMLEPVMREEKLLPLSQEAAGSVQNGEIIELDVPEDLQVRTDRNMLLTCLRNLLDNAVKVSPEGGRVLLKARGKTVTITDEGPGMKEGSEWGHGLGLVITRELLGKMGVAMETRNRPGKGLEITLNL